MMSAIRFILKLRKRELVCKWLSLPNDEAQQPAHAGEAIETRVAVFAWLVCCSVLFGGLRLPFVILPRIYTLVAPESIRGIISSRSLPGFDASPLEPP
jgi:hypothetical protein